MTGEESIAQAEPSESFADLESEPHPAQAAIRAQILAQFEQWLDQTLAGELPPRGVPEHLLDEATAIVTGQQPAPESDLYMLFSSLTGLTGEIKLQGRAFKQLSDLLAPLSRMPDQLAQLIEMQREEDESSPLEFKQTCSLMIDLYDRLQRGLHTCDEGIAKLASRGKGGWMQKLMGVPGPSEQAILSVKAIRDAAALTLARLQSALQDWGIQLIGRIGDSFDTERMTAVDIRTDDTVGVGTVLAVNRSGYAINGNLKATAQVTVSQSTH